MCSLSAEIPASTKGAHRVNASRTGAFEQWSAGQARPGLAELGWTVWGGAGIWGGWGENGRGRAAKPRGGGAVDEKGPEILDIPVGLA